MGMPKRALQTNVEDDQSIKRSRKSDESNEVSTSVSGNSNHFSVKMKLTHSDQSDEEQVKNVAVKKNVITAASKLDEFTKIPGLQNISEDTFKLLDKKSLLISIRLLIAAQCKCVTFSASLELVMYSS